MPKSFDKLLLGFSSGNTGFINSSNVSYTVDGNIITGSLNNTLQAGQALTVRLTLPEGYFSAAKTTISIYPIFVIIISLICVLIADRIWVKYGKDNTVVETVEFYPPEGYNSAEVGFMYNGKADNPGVISLLIYLADKGYLKIEELKDKKNTGFRITKLKEYDGNNENEKIFFNGLFENASNNSSSGNESVTTSDLYGSFFTTLNKIKNNLNSKKSKDKIFESFTKKKSIWLVVMVALIFLLITITPDMEYTRETLTFALLFPGIGFSALFWLLFGKLPISSKIFGVIWGLGFGGIPWLLLVLPSLSYNILYIIAYAVGIMCVALIILFLRLMPKRTPFGNEMLGKLRGFKRFLETAEKPQLESLVSENPEYFYNILPYTYALGVSDVWISQFETIALQAPNWYDSRDYFDMHHFRTFMNRTMSSASAAMSSVPKSTGYGSGGFSGGGFSGGGSGGGGGGSW